MAKYEPGDIVTYYFIVYNDGDHKNIQAWTDNKDLAKFYMEFHSCKHLILKSLTKRIEEIAKILEENRNDEIRICNLMVRNSGKRKKGEETKLICVPVTETESLLIQEECSTFMASAVRYSYLNSAVPYLKSKYRRGLDDIFLSDIINSTCNTRSSKMIELIHLDQLLVLFRMLPHTFGK